MVQAFYRSQYRQFYCQYQVEIANSALICLALVALLSVTIFFLKGPHNIFRKLMLRLLMGWHSLDLHGLANII